MDVVVQRCSGLDVHKDSVMATVRTPGPAGQREEVTREFGTTTAGSAWHTRRAAGTPQACAARRNVRRRSSRANVASTITRCPSKSSRSARRRHSS